MKGRKPKLKLIEGGTAAVRCPTAPGWFSLQARAEWKRSAPQLQGRRLLAPDMLGTLESYCIAVGVVRETEEIMCREGRMIDTDEGPKQHPAFRMQSAAMREARLLAAELGLTPHRRGGKETEEVKGDEWASDLLA